MADNLPQPRPEDYRPDDEIDLVALIETLWDGKWTIIGMTGLACTLAVSAVLALKMPFEATTVIRPISTIAADDYAESNALQFFEITREDLELLFIEKLRDGRILEAAAKQIPLFERDEFGSDVEYQEKILEFVESIQLLPPVNEDGRERGASRRNWEFIAEYHDEDKWLRALRYVQERTNEEIGNVLRARFTTAISVSQQRRQFEREDLTTKIQNAIADYERDTLDRLAFLDEQAAIARKLGVAKNTIEAQTFSAQGGVLASVEMDTPFYLRGYEAIEKEIDLIKSREYKRAFVEGLSELERTLRTLEQDKTLERAQILFENTPVWTGKSFIAANFIPEGTAFIDQNSKPMITVLVSLLSGMLSCFYVLVSGVMRKRQVKEPQAES